MKLPPNAFKLWAYLNAHSNEFEFGLSSKDVMQICSMSRNTYDKAVKDLIDAGYLIKVELRPNLEGYLFLEEGNGGEQ